MTQTTGSDPARSGAADRAHQLFEFLAEANELRTKAVRTLDAAQRVVWFDELPDDPSVLRTFLAPGGVGSDAWVSMNRVEPAPAPQPPRYLVDWLPQETVRDFTATQAPALRDFILVDREVQDDDGAATVVTVPLDLADARNRDGVLAAHERWSAQWLAWAEERRRIAPAAKAYADLYAMTQQANEDGELYELVLGLGFLTQRSGGQEVRRHLVVSGAAAAYDTKTGAITIGPDPDAPRPALEEDMLDQTDRARRDVFNDVTARMEQTGTLDEEVVQDFRDVIRSWTYGKPDGRYLDDTSRHRNEYEAYPVVSFAPALILRPRGLRSLVGALREIGSQIDRTGRPSALISYLVDPSAATADPSAADLRIAPDDRDGVHRHDAPEDFDEPFFALPSNAEQRRIVERLRTQRLVVVQGPPGTGKTHTIANLLTDLLARGKRVLITSQTARALKVLKDKLPEDLRPLCVSRADDGVEGQQELEQSIWGILSRHGDYDATAARQEIDRLTLRLREARLRQGDALKDLRTIREMESYVYGKEIGDYEGTPLRIAERLREEAPKFAWIGPVPDDATPLTSAAALTLLRATRSLPPGLPDRHVALPDADLLPAADAFAADVTAIARADRAVADVRSRFGDAVVEAVAGLPDDRKRALQTHLEPFAQARSTLTAYRTPWVDELRGQILFGQDQALRRRRAMSADAIRTIDAHARQLGPALVSGLDRFDLPTALGYARVLHDGLQAGRKLSGPLGTKGKLLKEIEPFHDAVRVDGLAVEDLRSVIAVLHRIEIERQLQTVEQEWGHAAQPWHGHSARVSALESQLDILDQLLEFSEHLAALHQAVSGASALAATDWMSPLTTDALRDMLHADAGVRSTARLRSANDSRVKALWNWSAAHAPAPGPVAAATAALEALDAAAYRVAVDGTGTGGTRSIGGTGSIGSIRADNATLHSATDAYEVVAASHPDLADRIRGTSDDPGWDERLRHTERAWAWSRWNTRLALLTDPDAERTARIELAEADGEARLALQRLAAARAWQYCLSRITDEQSRALNAYQTNIRRIGKGTGRHANRYREAARKNLSEAQASVPAWIMPLYQVVDTVPMDAPERFDVVIIDEASQSGLDALLLCHLGRQLVIVGDDKQVSPSSVGLDQDQFDALKQRRLTDLPYSAASAISPLSSLFQFVGDMTSGRGKLMLTEHFRCMPEIIDYSNRWFYGGRLQPLRQYGSDRLPPIRTTYVRGAAEGVGTKTVNRAEAEALVDTVVGCCDDPAYEGRTMGVVTMLGTAQSALIEDLLAERLSVAARRERRLRVGNAEAFQGDERHVMFMSMVVSREGADGERRLGTFSGTGYEQRLNVAASRAQDQVWVFHSVHPGDLTEKDLRRGYLEYVSRPIVAHDAYLDGEVRPDERREPFDSLFEQRVYLALRTRGYRVRPQFKAGRYNIDLVVEGGTRRLAVECDGDAFHTEQNAGEDAARQRELERVGWTFVRIRGSRFFRDPDEALLPLWAELDRMGIKPIGWSAAEAS